MANQALVRYVGAQTPLQAFLETLTERQSDSALRSMHSATWTSLPLERLFVDGSWVLLQAVAGKYRWSLSTKNDVEVVADRVDRLVAVGLLLRHQTPQEAALAFERQVIAALDLAVSVGYRPGQTLSSDAWRGLMCGQTESARRELSGAKAPAAGALSAFWAAPCYLFLADCFRSAREFGEDLMARLDRFMVANVIPVGRMTGVRMLEDVRALYVNEDDQVAEAVRFLDVSRDSAVIKADATNPFRQPGEQVYTLHHCPKVIEAEAILVEMELRLATLRAIPIDLSSMTGRLIADSKGIDENWVRGRLLCAAIGIKSEILPSRMFGTALRAIAKLTDEQLIDLATAQVLERGTRWTPEEEACFRAMLTSALPSVRRPIHDLSIEGGQDMMVDVDPVELALDDSAALDVALDRYPAINQQIATWSDQRLRAYLKRRVLPAIEWSRLDAQVMLPMFSVSVVPLDLLFGCVAKLKAKERKTLVRTLLEGRPELAPRLIDAGLAELNLELFNRHGDSVDKKRLVNFLTIELEKLSRKHGPKLEGKISIVRLFRSLVGLPTKEREQIWRQPGSRQALVGLVDVLIVESSYIEHGLHASEVRDFPFQVGIESWRDFVAAVLVWRREQEYGQAIDREHFTTAWSQLGNPEHPDYEENVSAFAVRRFEKLGEVLAVHTEERAFRFLHEGDIILEKCWADYLKAQAKYHRAHAR